MQGMKVTVDAAMRARDVSRPHAEHEALADVSEPEPGRARDRARQAGEAGQAALQVGSAAAERAAELTGPAATISPGGPPKPRSPRRRRRHR
jgi:hypothetical protein